MKRFSEIDSLRIIASILVFISHYSFPFQYGNLSLIGDSLTGLTGRVGVSIFFAVSGYLAAHSLSKKDSSTIFYLKRAIRVLAPYNIAYFFISSILIALGAINLVYFNAAPITNIITGEATFIKILPVFFGLDGISNALFGTQFYFLTGEWFIGTLIFLYLLSPLLFKFITINIKSSLIFIIISILTSTLIFHLITGKINNPFWFFLVRIPDFLIGMFLFQYRSLVLAYGKIILFCSWAISLLWTTYHLATPHELVIADSVIPLAPSSWIVSIPLTLIFFITSVSANNTYNLDALNHLSKYSYLFMLMQHVVINIYLPQLPTSEFTLFGFIFMLFFTMTLTVALAHLARKITSPVERFLMYKVQGMVILKKIAPTPINRQ
ncbi:acyltransferase family protein [Franconibacter helveticus]|uniref:acyltransferase family protein n=1 Tax=Franconibacter helveticus TaxID=357240 RepID=UPI00094953F7|nr:acyltransferase [Franconibacter helveticus]